MNEPSFGFDLSITFLNAEGLRIADISGSSDPYIIANINNLVTYRTKTVLCTVNPTWNEEWWVSNVPPGAIVNIDIWDYDFMKADDSIGNVRFTFCGQTEERIIEEDVRFGGVVHGKLVLKIIAVPSQFPGEMHSTGPVRYELHHSSMAAALIHHHTDEDKVVYSSYKIYLPNVSSCFQNKTQRWNKNYRPAQIIFAQHPRGIIARRIIHSMNATLYRPTASSKYGVLSKGKDFLEMINYGERKGIRRFFTYVILGDSMRFSETGAPFFLDFISKHTVHSDCAKEVFFSGEFCVSKVEQTWTLFIDNNSGTYTPRKDDLPNLAECMQQIFPYLVVEALDKDDPKMVALRGPAPKPESPHETDAHPMQAYRQYFSPTAGHSSVQQQLPPPPFLHAENCSYQMRGNFRKPLALRSGDVFPLEIAMIRI